MSARPVSGRLHSMSKTTIKLSSLLYRCVVGIFSFLHIFFVCIFRVSWMSHRVTESHPRHSRKTSSKVKCRLVTEPACMPKCQVENCVANVMICLANSRCQKTGETPASIREYSPHLHSWNRRCTMHNARMMTIIIIIIYSIRCHDNASSIMCSCVCAPSQSNPKPKPEPNWISLWRNILSFLPLHFAKNFLNKFECALHNVQLPHTGTHTSLPNPLQKYSWNERIIIFGYGPKCRTHTHSTRAQHQSVSGFH